MAASLRCQSANKTALLALRLAILLKSEVNFGQKGMKSSYHPRPNDDGRATMWLVAVLAAALLISALMHDWSEIWIYQDGRQRPATISAGRSHGVFEYEYIANGVHYSGQGQSGRYLSSNTRVGQSVLVWVSASHPQFSSPEMPIFSPWVELAIAVALVGAEIVAVKNLVRIYRTPKKPVEAAIAAPGS